MRNFISLWRGTWCRSWCVCAGCRRCYRECGCVNPKTRHSSPAPLNALIHCEMQGVARVTGGDRAVTTFLSYIQLVNAEVDGWWVFSMVFYQTTHVVLVNEARCVGQRGTSSWATRPVLLGIFLHQMGKKFLFLCSLHSLRSLFLYWWGLEMVNLGVKVAALRSPL